MFPREKFCPILCTTVVLVTKLVNSVMLDGKKGVAQKVVYSAFDMIKDKTGNEPLEFSTRPWRISCPAWRPSPAVSAAPPIRSRWRSVPPVVRPSVCVG